MSKIKTDIEVAADAIKYCRRELKKYNDLLVKYEEYEKDVIGERTIAMWEYERQRLESVLGISDVRPIFPYVKEDIHYGNKNF